MLNDRDINSPLEKRTDARTRAVIAHGTGASHLPEYPVPKCTQQ